MIERDKVSKHKGIPDLGMPPTEGIVDVNRLVRDIRQLFDIKDVKIRRRPKYDRA